MKPIFRSLAALVFLIPIVSSMGTPAGAAKEDCRLEPGQGPQCMWDQEDFQGAKTVADPSGQCTNSSIRSAANNGKSGYFTLYLYKDANCAGNAVSKLNAGESVGSVTATSARFGPKGS
jgi:hypothetical protein